MAQDKISLTLESRSTTGKAVKQLRRDGLVPAVIHDHGKASVLVQGDYQTVLKTYLKAGKHHPIALKAGDKSYTAMIKSIEFEPKKHAVNHVVFGAVNAREKIEAEIPVHPQYAEGNEQSPAERNSLIVINNATTVLVEATASNMPDALYFDAEKLVEIGDHITAADLDIPEDVELKSELETTLATVYEPSALAAANDAAGGDAEEATGEEAAEVESEHGSAEDDKPTQEDEIRPGGKKEFEDKSQGHNPEKK